MDEIDKKQQEQIDSLHEKAEKNRKTDFLQWLVILIFSVVILIYFNLALIGTINNQADSIKKLAESFSLCNNQ